MLYKIFGTCPIHQIWIKFIWNISPIPVFSCIPWPTQNLVSIHSLNHRRLWLIVHYVDGEVLPWKLVYICHQSVFNISTVHVPSELTESVSFNLTGYPCREQIEMTFKYRRSNEMDAILHGLQNGVPRSKAADFGTHVRVDFFVFWCKEDVPKVSKTIFESIYLVYI